jgi:EAL domain-containing protein (putative c-di-GMP-specific phosphodiesterase class I)
VALGRGLGLMTIAKGAEQMGEVEILRSLGCDCVQGYVFARPVTAEEAIGVAADIERSHRAARAVA